MEYRDIHSSDRQVEKSLQAISNSSMSKIQKEKIVKFVSDLRIGKAGKKVKDRRIGSYLQFLLRLNEYFNKDLDKITEKTAEDFYRALQEDEVKKKNGMPYSQASKDEYVKTLKRYLGWAWGKDSIKYRKSIKWMKEDYKKSEKKAITLKECEKVLKQNETERNKCLFMFGFDSGGRIEEILNVRIKDLRKSTGQEKYFMVHLRGTKTEEADRTISIPLTTKYINKWLKKHPTKDEEDYLFPIKYDNARKIIKQMSKKVLGFELKPHELRHSSATHYIQFGGFGHSNMGGFYYRYGWKFGSGEARTYIKQSMIGGEMGQDKVVKAIEGNKVEELEKKVEDLQEMIGKYMDVLKEHSNPDNEKKNIMERREEMEKDIQ